jgi:hypothetical protein
VTREFLMSGPEVEGERRALGFDSEYNRLVPPGWRRTAKPIEAVALLIPYKRALMRGSAVLDEERRVAERFAR